MRAALHLRLLEARRRGGLPLFAAAAVGVGAVAFAGTDTVEGSYGLASDIAAALAYLGAIFFGAYPLASDRERKRSFVPAASPVTAWGWALGNAAGAAVAAGAAALVLFAAAGTGTALRGGIETREAIRLPDAAGIRWLPLKGSGSVFRIRLDPDVEYVRIVTQAHLVADETVGTPDAAVLEIGGRTYPVFWHSNLLVPVTQNPLEIYNTTPDFTVGLVKREFRALAGRRPFLVNALGAGVAPALCAAALAALGAAAGAHLSAPVAALLLALLLLLASLKGFLLEMFAYEASLARAQQAQGAGQADDHGHDHTHAPPGEPPGRTAAKRAVEAILGGLPDLPDFDRCDRVALGEWTGVRRGGPGAGVLAVGLALATLVGGAGVHLRRTP